MICFAIVALKRNFEFTQNRIRFDSATRLGATRLPTTGISLVLLSEVRGLTLCVGGEKECSWRPVMIDSRIAGSDGFEFES
jgi:hypothetical protein